jgi:hypothetical protein
MFDMYFFIFFGYIFLMPAHRPLSAKEMLTCLNGGADFFFSPWQAIKVIVGQCVRCTPFFSTQFS